MRAPALGVSPNVLTSSAAAAAAAAALLCRQVGYAEVCLSSLDPSSADALALSQRLAARQPGTDTWRGFSVSSPFLPGVHFSILPV
jgi:hypothetical protein